MEIKIAMDPAQAFEANLLARLKPINEITARGTSAVQEFYSGATVFLTGGSGFLGMQLIEKLLRATKLSKIFVLLRCKKGKSIEQRMLEMLQDPLYDLVREQQPDFAEKLVPVSGDVAELRLGLSEEDWKTITEQTDIIFHVAATTRFDESLRVATLINIRGTREALTLGKACKKLRSYIHVSTAYSHACVDRINTEVSETFYKSPVSPKAMIQLAEYVNEGRLNDMTPSLIKNWPNTYTFTKSIAEDLINTMGDELPVCVVKPAAVACCKLEPVPGWLHNSCLYGASGIYLAVYLGVLHSLSVRYENFMDLIPVDYVNNAIIAAGWETAKKRGTGENKTRIYTLSASFRNPINWAEFKTIVERNVQKYPTPMTIGYLCIWNARNPILFWIHFWLLQVIPAYIMDGISIILGNKRRFVKLATKMSKLSSAATYFFCNQWYLNDKNTALLFDSLSDEDRVIFNFDVDDIDWKEYVITWAIGLRKYIVKDGLKDTIYARKKQMVLKFLTFIILPLYFYCLYKMLYFVLSRFLLFW